MEGKFMDEVKDAGSIEENLKKLPRAVKERVNDIITGALMLQEAQEQRDTA